jgi:hypothetical protein
VADFDGGRRCIPSIARAGFERRPKCTFFGTDHRRGTFPAISVKNIKKDGKTATHLCTAHIFPQNKAFWFHLSMESLNLYSVGYTVGKLIPKHNINKDIWQVSSSFRKHEQGTEHGLPPGFGGRKNTHLHRK